MSAPMEAICEAAGWKYCAEHDKARYDGSNPCAPLHRSVETTHDQACSWPNDDCTCDAFAPFGSSQEAPKASREQTETVRAEWMGNSAQEAPKA